MVVTIKLRVDLSMLLIHVLFNTLHTRTQNYYDNANFI